MKTFCCNCRCKPLPLEQSLCNTLKGRGTPNGFRRVQRYGLSSNLGDIEFAGIKHFGKYGDPQLSDKCLDLVLHIFCMQAAPPCNPVTGLPMLICEDSCRIFQQIQENRICSDVDKRLRDVYDVTLQLNFKILADAYFNYNCSDPTNYYFMNVTDPDPNLCTSVCTPTIEGKKIFPYNDPRMSSL